MPMVRLGRRVPSLTSSRSLLRSEILPDWVSSASSFPEATRALTKNLEPVERFLIGNCGVRSVLGTVRFAARIAIERPPDNSPVTGKPIFA